MARVAEIRVKLMTLAKNKGLMARKLVACKPHEVTAVIMAQEAIDAEILKLGHELQALHDRALAQCP